MSKKVKKFRMASVREIARLTGYSPAHVCYARRGLRISRPLHAKMRELGLTFEPATLREALKRQGKEGK